MRCDYKHSWCLHMKLPISLTKCYLSIKSWCRKAADENKFSSVSSHISESETKDYTLANNGCKQCLHKAYCCFLSDFLSTLFEDVYITTWTSGETNYVHPQAVIKDRQKTFALWDPKVWVSSQQLIKMLFQEAGKFAFADWIICRYSALNMSILFINTVWTLFKHWLWCWLSTFTSKIDPIIFCSRLKGSSSVQKTNDEKLVCTCKSKKKVLKLKCNYEFQTKGLKCGIGFLNSHLFFIYPKSQFHG